MMSVGAIRDLNNVATIKAMLAKLSEPDLLASYEEKVAQLWLADDPYWENLDDARQAAREDLMGWPSDLLEELADKLVEMAREDNALPGPLSFTPHDIADRLRQIPNLGRYGSETPDGYEEIDRLFVDKSGFGAPDEPALTFHQFVGKVRTLAAEHGTVYLALVEEGQFQVYVGVYRRAA
jgi:hypothetical protein